MKDIHGERATPGRIPIVSPFLHCVAMTALVYLRASFGYTLFRPRSIFFALSFAVAVLSYIAWNEPTVWREYWTVCIFALGAVALYWLHFAVTVRRELQRRSERDDYAGASHVARIITMFRPTPPVSELRVSLLFEPLVIFGTALLLRYVFHELHLSAWFAFVAPCMFCKELMNHWTAIRREKIAGDITADAAEQSEALGDEQKEPEAPRATRIPGQKLSRQRTAATQSPNHEQDTSV